MMPHGRCPVCGQTVATHDGRLVRHHGTQMRWSGVRWFRTTCRGSGRAVSVPETGLGATSSVTVGPSATEVIPGPQFEDSQEEA